MTISRYLFNCATHLIFSRRAREFRIHHDSGSVTYAARIGLLHLALHRCFVLHHDDLHLSIRFPTPWGKLHLGCVICPGTGTKHPSGAYIHWYKRLPQVIDGQPTQPPAIEEELPF